MWWAWSRIHLCQFCDREREEERQKNRLNTQMGNIFALSHKCKIPVPFSDTLLFSQIKGLWPISIIPEFKFSLVLVWNWKTCQRKSDKPSRRLIASVLYQEEHLYSLKYKSVFGTPFLYLEYGEFMFWPGGRLSWSYIFFIHACKSWEFALKYVMPDLFLDNNSHAFSCEALGYSFNRLVTII